MGRAGIVEGYVHSCRKPGCGHSEKAADKAQRDCPNCGRALWLKPVVRKLRFHDLRHTTATLLLKAKVPLAIVQRILRHTDPKVTSEVYGHLDLDDLRDGLKALDFGPLAERAPAPVVPLHPTFAANLLPTGSNPKGEAPDPFRRSERNQGPRLVGATGFEPATTCTPSKCATRLRYAPALLSRWLGLLRRRRRGRGKYHPSPAPSTRTRQCQNPSERRVFP